MTNDQILQLALEHHHAGRLAEAEAIYRQVLARVPDHADALHLLGLLATQTGHADAAIELIGRAIAIAPGIAEYHSNLGEACRRSGRLDEAVAAFTRAIALKPTLAQAYNNLGLAQHALGRRDEAVAACQEAVRHAPRDAESHANLGVVLNQSDRIDEAIAAYRRALELGPEQALVHSNLGVALHAAGRSEEAIAAYRRALALAPGQAETQNNLGVALAATGRPDLALAACNEAVALWPDYAQAHHNRGNALSALQRFDEAIAAYQRAIALAPDDACAHNNLGSALSEQGPLDEAIAAFRRALALDPTLAPAHANLGIALADQGKVSQAIDSLRRSIALEPHGARAHSSLVYMRMFCPGQDTRALCEESRRWNERHAAPQAAQIQPHPIPARRDTPDRRLKVGYVSPDFRAHSQAVFTVPLFAAHNHEQFAIHAYADVAVPDQVTARLKSCADVWRDIRGRSSEQVAEIVRQDRIDILVDLTMHMTGEHLEVFARKPAPAQVCWLAYPGTTGLSAIDYRLTDPYLDPPGEDESLFSEQTVRLPRCFWCYDPLTSEPPVNPLPALERGAITFGSLNNFCKVNEPVLSLWARVLDALPGARLLLLAREGSHRDETRVFLEREGIAPDRVRFAAPAPRARYLELYHQIDLGLDPFPYPGHTTTFDSLWMGVPVVTLAGSTPVGRGGVSILSNLGLPELIAQTPEQYVTIATDLAGDWRRLAELRAGLRRRMESSALMDAKRFAADFEAALRRMWENWCAG